MHDRPDPTEQLNAVVQFLREQVLPRLDGQTAHHTRVAANMLDVVRRQWLAAGTTDVAEVERLQDLLGRPGELADLNAELADRIADGRVDASTPGLADHLWRVTLDKLAVDQPRYETYRRVVESHAREDT